MTQLKTYIDESRKALKTDNKFKDNTIYSYVNSFKKVCTNALLIKDDDEITKNIFMNEQKVKEYLESISSGVAKTLLNGYLNCVKHLLNRKFTVLEKYLGVLGESTKKEDYQKKDKDESNEVSFEDLEKKRDELKIKLTDE